MNQEPSILRDIFLGIFAIIVVISFVVTFPPADISGRLTTGSEAGAYHRYAAEYRQFIRESGEGWFFEPEFDLAIQASRGSVDNLERLCRDQSDLAIVQGGIPHESLQRPTACRYEGLLSIMRVFPEALWILAPADQDIENIYDLRDKTIDIGRSGSGTRVMADLILQEHGLSPRPEGEVSESGSYYVEVDRDDKACPFDDPREMIRQLAEGECAEVLFYVVSVNSDIYREIVDGVRNKRIKVISIDHAETIARRYGHLRHLTMEPGDIGLVDGPIPARPIEMLVSEASLITRRDTNRLLIAMMIHAALAVHENTPGLFRSLGNYPKFERYDGRMPILVNAERIAEHENSFFFDKVPLAIFLYIENSFEQFVVIIVLAITISPITVWFYNRIYNYLRFLLIYKKWYDRIYKVEDAFIRREAAPGVFRCRIRAMDKVMSRLNIKRKQSHVDDYYRLRGMWTVVKDSMLREIERRERPKPSRP